MSVCVSGDAAAAEVQARGAGGGAAAGATAVVGGGGRSDAGRTRRVRRGRRACRRARAARGTHHERRCCSCLCSVYLHCQDSNTMRTSYLTLYITTPQRQTPIILQQK